MTLDWTRRAGAILTLAALCAGCGSSSSTTATAKGKGADATPRETLNKNTDKVLRLADALADGGQIAEAGGTIGPSGGYLGTLVKTSRQVSGMAGEYAINQAIQAHEILDGPIKDFEEFQAVIMKKGQPDAPSMPMLPFYQEYAYDEANHKLVVVEFPKRLEEYEKNKK